MLERRSFECTDVAAVAASLSQCAATILLPCLPLKAMACAGHPPLFFLTLSRPFLIHQFIALAHRIH